MHFKKLCKKNLHQFRGSFFTYFVLLQKYKTLHLFHISFNVHAFDSPPKRGDQSSLQILKKLRSDAHVHCLFAIHLHAHHSSSSPWLTSFRCLFLNQLTFTRNHFLFVFFEWNPVILWLSAWMPYCHAGIAPLFFLFRSLCSMQTFEQFDQLHDCPDFPPFWILSFFYFRQLK